MIYRNNNLPCGLWTIHLLMTLMFLLVTSLASNLTEDPSIRLLAEKDHVERSAAYGTVRFVRTVRTEHTLPRYASELKLWGNAMVHVQYTLTDEGLEKAFEFGSLNYCTDRAAPRLVVCEPMASYVAALSERALNQHARELARQHVEHVREQRVQALKNLAQEGHALSLSQGPAEVKKVFNRILGLLSEPHALPLSSEVIEQNLLRALADEAKVTGFPADAFSSLSVTVSGTATVRVD